MSIAAVCRCVSEDSVIPADTPDSEGKMSEVEMWADLGSASSDEFIEELFAEEGASPKRPFRHLVAYVTPKTDDPDAARVFVYIHEDILPLLVLVKDKRTKGAVVPVTLCYALLLFRCSSSTCSCMSVPTVKSSWPSLQVRGAPQALSIH